MRINPLIKYLTNVKKDDVMHSSGYAKSQNSGGFGSTDTRSFTKRKELEQNRNLVGGYDKSKIGMTGRVNYYESSRVNGSGTGQNIKGENRVGECEKKGGTGGCGRTESTSGYGRADNIGGYGQMEGSKNGYGRSEGQMGGYGRINNTNGGYGRIRNADVGYGRISSYNSGNGGSHGGGMDGRMNGSTIGGVGTRIAGGTAGGTNMSIGAKRAANIRQIVANAKKRFGEK